MEKHGWSQSLGQEMLSAYDRVMPLTSRDRESSLRFCCSLLYFKTPKKGRYVFRGSPAGLHRRHQRDCQPQPAGVPKHSPYRDVARSMKGGVNDLDAVLHLVNGFKAAKGQIPADGEVVKSIVTTNLVDAVAAGYNCKLVECLTGFKFLMLSCILSMAS